MSEAVGIVRDFIGLNADRPDTNIGPNEASEALNVMFSDYSVRKRNGSTRITPWVCPKGAMAFSGSDECAETPSISDAVYTYAWALDTKFTMEVSGWLSATATDTRQVIAERGDMGTNRAGGWVLQVDRDSHCFHFGCALTAGSDIWMTGTWSNFSTEKPFHLAVRRDGADVTMWLKDDETEVEIGSQSGLTASATESISGAYPVTFASGMAYVGDTDPSYFAGRLQGFRTWNDARSTASISAWALKELPGHALDTSTIRFYYKMSEGDSTVAYDYGHIAYVGWDTMTNFFAARFSPSAPEWVDGIVSGGLGDYAIEFDGIDDFAGAVNVDDVYSTLRTGTEAWSVQAILKPGEQIQDNAVFLMYGAATHTPGSSGFAFRLRGSVDRSTPSWSWIADFCFATETLSITYGTEFVPGNKYGVTIQRTYDEVRLRVDDLTNEADGGYDTDTVSSPGAPAFGTNEFFMVGAGRGTGATVDTAHAACTIDDVRVFSGVRYHGFDAQIASPDASLLSYWKFNDGSGDVVSDASANRCPLYTFPHGPLSPWAAGLVEPVEGADILGIHEFVAVRDANRLNDARERSLLVNAGACLYRNEGGEWNELLSGIDGDKLSTAAQLGNFMAICNGANGNLLYDGDLLWPNGVVAPSIVGTASVYSPASGTWDTGARSDDYCFGASGITAQDSARTEPGYTFNGRAFLTTRASDTVSATTTIETVCERYHHSLTIPVTLIATSSTSSLLYEIYSPAFGTASWDMKKGYLEGAVLSIDPTGTWGTQYLTINQEARFSPPTDKRWRWVWTLDTAYSLGGVLALNPTDLTFTRHFVWKDTATAQMPSTATYTQVLQVGTLEGYYHYRHTNYNRYTGIESMPSEPTYERVGPNQEIVFYEAAQETSTNVTDRRVYRTLRDGARLGPDYYFVGTMTGTGTSTFVDLVPFGEEGELISFYREVPPKASLCKTFKSRVWYNSVANPNYLYFSTVLKPAEVDPYNFMVFGDQSDPITGISYYGDSLLVFKRRSTWVVSRADVPAGMRPTCISRSIGCVSHHSIVETDSEVIFLSERGVYAFRGGGLQMVSSRKIQWYMDRLNPERLDKAVAAHLQDEGVYRLNVSPESTSAGSLRPTKNPWQFDYHYRASGEGRQFYEPIWSRGEREVSCYGEYVDRYGMRYPAYGDFRGALCLDNMPQNYTDGLGWYRKSSVWSTTGAVGDDPLTAGAYTVTVNGGSLSTYGHGLKGLAVHLVGSSTSETHIIYSNTANQVVLQTPTSNDYAAGDAVFVAPIHSRYKTGWMDFGKSYIDKKIRFLRLDYRVQDETSTMTVVVRGARVGSSRVRTVVTQTVDQSGVTQKLSVPGAGKHLQIEYQHSWPGETFEIFNWELLLQGGGGR